jgi:type III pantothenate kinase
MDINLLALGVGNSRLAMGSFLSGELTRVDREPLADPAHWQAALESEIKRGSSADRPIVAASVNRALNSQIEEIVKSATGQTVQWVGRQIDLPISVLTETPAETGVDRVLNVAAAFEQLEKACIVVDAGTALTVDCCNDNGDFLGGAILPGMSMMLDALARNTAGVGRVTFQPPTGPVGNSTAAAVSHGVFYAIRGLVRDVAENLATSVGRWPEIIATGGDAETLFKDWELIHAISPDLGLYGIALAYTEHHLRNEEPD